MHAVEIEDVTKTYGATRAVDGVSLTIEEGEVLALLGPNGAGKSTLIEILEGHRRRDSGRVSVLGFDPQRAERAFRERIGIVLQEAGFEDEFTVAELVRYFRTFYPHPRPVAEVLADTGLAESARMRVTALSGGQRRRLDLALGLVGDPRMLFLDEPTVGFDPAARRHAWSVVEGLRGRGVTVLLTTHYLDEAERLADRVAVIRSGRLVAVGTPAELTTAHEGSVVAFRMPRGLPTSALPDLGAPLEPDGPGWRVSTRHASAVAHALTGAVLDRGLELPSLEVRRPSLEDAYLAMIGAAPEHSDADAALERS